MTYRLAKVASANVTVCVSPKTSVELDCVVCSPANFPKRESAATIAHRCAAQNGLNSAPT